MMDVSTVINEFCNLLPFRFTNNPVGMIRKFLVGRYVFILLVDFLYHSGWRDSILCSGDDQHRTRYFLFIHLCCSLAVNKPEPNFKGSAARLVNEAFINLFLLCRGKKVKHRIDGFLEGLSHGCFPEGPSEQHAPEALNYRWCERKDSAWRSRA